jgi:CubicO group peptidase (beta-lactamase class C family)
MKTKILVTLLAVFAAPLGFAKAPPDMQARLDEWQKGRPGGVAAAWVDADGTAFFQAGRFGISDPQPITPDTQFEIGSITKVFTALLLAESERCGKVGRDDAAAKFLLPSDDPDQARLAKITLLSLATHTSGLPRMPASMKDADPSDPFANYDRAALVASLRDHGATAPAGQAASYSNLGASVLGEALAAAWGESYAEALREHVLDPLGLKATTVGIAGNPPPPGLAPAHTGGKETPHWTWQAGAPCGGIRSSSRDMAAFLEACLGKRPVLQAALKATLTPQFPYGDTGGHIGLAWMLTDDAERPIVWHNGATAGSHAFLAFDPKAGRGVVILANMPKASGPLGFSLLGGQMPQPATAVANAADYPGSYPLTPGFIIAVTEAKGSLFVQATSQPRLALRPVSADHFAVIGAPAEVSFERGADGKVTALILSQNGRDQRGPRGEPPPPPREVALSPEILVEYAGVYPVAPAFMLTVTVEDGALFVQATGQPKFPVFATAKDEFFYKVVEARISFQRDAAGGITGLVLHQNGRDLPAKKN